MDDIGLRYHNYNKADVFFLRHSVPELKYLNEPFNRFLLFKVCICLEKTFIIIFISRLGQDSLFHDFATQMLRRRRMPISYPQKNTTSKNWVVESYWQRQQANSDQPVDLIAYIAEPNQLCQISFQSGQGF